MVVDDQAASIQRIAGAIGLCEEAIAASESTASLSTFGVSGKKRTREDDRESSGAIEGWNPGISVHQEPGAEIQKSAVIYPFLLLCAGGSRESRELPNRKFSLQYRARLDFGSVVMSGLRRIRNPIQSFLGPSSKLMYI